MNKLTFDDIDELVAISQDPLTDWPLEIGNNNKKELYYRFLYHLINKICPKLCMEIGVEYGLGSAHMCTASNFAVIGIDHNTSHLIQNLCSFYDNYHFINKDSASLEAQKAVANLVETHGPLGIVFQDSSHHYEPSCQEWDLYSQFLDENAIWICDDITSTFQRPGLDDKSMVGYFEERPGEKKLYDNLHHGSVVGVIIL